MTFIHGINFISKDGRTCSITHSLEWVISQKPTRQKLGLSEDQTYLLSNPTLFISSSSTNLKTSSETCQNLRPSGEE